MNPQPADTANSLLNEDTFRETFESLRNDYSTVVATIESNRDNRSFLVDVGGLQAQGRLRSNETFIAQRIIDTNIARDIPPHVAYLTQSRRLAIFKPTDINQDGNHAAIETLELEFRRVMCYENWIEDYIRLVDGAKLNGFDFVSISYDPEKPGHVAVDHVGSDKLLFDMRVSDIQQAPMVARLYECTIIDLRELAAQYGFDEAVTNELAEKIRPNKSNNGNTNTSWGEANFVYRVFVKIEGKVYSGWYSFDLKKFLRGLEPFWNGVSEQVPTTEIPPGEIAPVTTMSWEKVTETKYPFRPYTNRVTENARIADTIGRADLDFYTQEAASSLWTAFVNGCITAANVMWSPDEPNPEVGTAPKQLNMVIDHGKIWNKPMRAFNAPYPDAMLPKSLELLKSQNAEDTNQISFATNNRKDTRKTATEIEAAQSQDMIMSSVTVTLFSSALREVFTAAWLIIQSEALQGKMTYAPLADGSGNDIELLKQSYNVIPAGTVDYIERMERLASMQADLPLIGQTAAGPAFLSEYLKAKYPELASRFIQPLEQAQQQSAQNADQLGQKVLALQALLKEAVTGPDGQLLSEWQPHSQEIQAVLANPGAVAQNQPSAETAQPAPETPQLTQ